MTVKHDRKAYQEGFTADETGKSPKCPYPAATLQSYSWHSGYIEGDAKRQGFETEDRNA